MGRPSNEDPLKQFRWRLSIGKFVRLGFTEMTGLKSETEEADYRESGMNETPQKSAGQTKYTDITLKRGVVIGSPKGGDNDFQQWREEVRSVSSSGTAANYRREMVLTLYNAQNQPVRKWTIFNAWAKADDATGDFVALGNENSIESLTVCHEGYTQTPV